MGDEFTPYDGQRETRLHDIQLKDGTIHKLMKPKNFTWKGIKGKIFQDKEVAGIRLSSGIHIFVPPKY